MTDYSITPLLLNTDYFHLILIANNLLFPSFSYR